MSKITNVRLPNAVSQNYDPQQFNQLVRSLEQIILQLNSTYTPVTSENTLGALSWFESRGESDMNGFPFSATSLDAFGRLRTSQPYTIFDSQNRYQPDSQYDTALTGAGSTSYLIDQSSVNLNVGTASGDKVIRQTFRSFPYQPGKSLLVLATSVMNAGKASLRQRVGYFNDGNGVFFQQNGTTLAFVLRTSTSGIPNDARTVAQASWNGDKLDGTGPSGLTLDVTKSQILFLDFEWLGVGSVRAGFVINGTFIVCHTFNNANDIDKVYMTTAILPLRYEIENTGATASSSALKQICSSVVSEGGYDQKSSQIWARRTSALTGVGTSFVPVVSVRLKATRTGAIVLPAAYSFLPTSSNDLFEVAVIKNATLSGASFTSLSANLEFDTSASSMSGGDIVFLDFLASTNQSRAPINVDVSYNFALQLGTSLSGTRDIYTLAMRLTTGTGDGLGAISFFDITDPVQGNPIIYAFPGTAGLTIAGVAPTVTVA